MKKQLSKHNIISAIEGSDNYYIVNLLSGNADILSGVEYEQIQQYREKGIIEDALLYQLEEKGYISVSENEDRLFKSKYLDFIDNRDNDEVQLFFVPNYSCNFTCSYCYQDEYQYSKIEVDSLKTIIDSFFEYIKNEFSDRKHYITLFGGEPLLNSDAQRIIIEHFIEKAISQNTSISIVTNGYSLYEYIDVIKKANVREVQVTLDGTASVHDSRRTLRGGGSSFEKIVKGIDACLEHDITINLRMVIDKDNIANIHKLASFAIEKGWTKSNFFKTQMGRNYELHHCQTANSRLFDRLSLYQELFAEIKKHPHLLEFYKPAYSVSKFLFENESLPDPLFDSCPACKTEWAFDYTGKIYPCTAYVGKTDEEIGTFYPEKTMLKDRVKIWENRDVISIKACTNCPVQLACGGGCGAISKNKTGEIINPDCRPVKELLSLGFAQYFH